MQPEALCPRCLKRGTPPTYASPPMCAFGNGVFNQGGHNWMCATANALRAILYDATDEDTGELVEFHGLLVMRSRADDETVALIHVVGKQDWIHLGWYKDRGAVQMMTDNYGNPLTLEGADAIIAVAERNGWKEPA